jgi:hypothetical protein
MTRWHEANEYGFAGDATMPEVRPDRPSEEEEVEAEAIPSQDLPYDVAEGVDDATGAAPERDHHEPATGGEDRH